jgi:hypothetical protein
MIREAQIVVGAKAKRPASIDSNDWPLASLDPARHTEQSAGLQPSQLAQHQRLNVHAKRLSPNAMNGNYRP